MDKITRLNLYLNEAQYNKLCLLANTSNKEPEEVANNVLYSYLLIVDPFAVDEDDEEEE